MTAIATAGVETISTQLNGYLSKDANNTTTTDTSSNSDDSNGDIIESHTRPSRSDLKKAADISLLDADKELHTFKSLYSGDRAARRVLVIFIRHFLCGNCQEYLRTLASSVIPASLLALPIPTEIVIIGCGKPDVIPWYTESTNCPFPIYAEPSRKLYDLLGMTRTLDLGSKSPDYIQSSIFYGAVKSIFQGLRNGRNVWKGGDLSQIGGEFLFEDGRVAWCHRMKNTRDHAEIPELRKVIGLDGEAPPTRRWSTNLKRSLSNRRQSWSRSRSRTRKDSPQKDSPGGSVMEKVKEDKCGEADGESDEIESNRTDANGTAGKEGLANGSLDGNIDT